MSNFYIFLFHLYHKCVWLDEVKNVRKILLICILSITQQLPFQILEELFNITVNKIV
jgi:hypothetical protein